MVPIASPDLSGFRGVSMQHYYFQESERRVTTRARLLELKAKGHNGVVFEHRLNKDIAGLLDMVEWAGPLFEHVHISLVPEAPLPAPDKVLSDIDEILSLGFVEVVYSGWGWSMDAAGIWRAGNEFRQSTVKDILTCVERRIIAAGVPVLGVDWASPHGRKELHYNHTSEWMSGCAVANLDGGYAASGMLLSKTGIEKRILGITVEGETVLGPLYQRKMSDNRFERALRIYASYGYGVIRDIAGQRK
jgi:hypothetical protein